MASMEEGTLKFGCVYIYDKGYSERLLSQGYGVKRKRTITKSCIILHESSSTTGASKYKQKEDSTDVLNAVRSSTDEILKKQTSDHNLIVNDKIDDNEMIPLANKCNDTPTAGEKQFNELEETEQNLSKENLNSSFVVLLDEESFYLLVSNKLIIKHSQDAVAVTPEELWQVFVDKNPRFPIKYKVYSYFQVKGFVVKSGVHFGVDYSLYRSLPSLCHSEMCVLVVDSTGRKAGGGGGGERSEVVPTAATTGTPSSDSSHINNINQQQHYSTLQYVNEAVGQLSWRQISTLTRVVPEVIKLFLTCYVLPVPPPSPSTTATAPTSIEEFCGLPPYASPSPPPAIDLSSSACLAALTVRPVTVTVRREVARGDGQMTVKALQKKYRACSQLKRARVETDVVRKWKDRRDPNANREKLQSKFKHIWHGLSGQQNDEAEQSSDKHDDDELVQVAAAAVEGEDNDLDGLSIEQAGMEVIDQNTVIYEVANEMLVEDVAVITAAAAVVVDNDIDLIEVEIS